MPFHHTKKAFEYDLDGTGTNANFPRQIDRRFVALSIATGSNGVPVVGRQFRIIAIIHGASGLIISRVIVGRRFTGG